MFGRDLLLICLFVDFSHGLFFHIGENETRCFVRELADNIPVIISYDLRLHDKSLKEFMNSAPGYGMYVEAKDPMNRLILSRTYESKQNISFTSGSPGDHRICMSPKTTSSNWFNFRPATFRVYIDIKVGERTIDYNKAAQREKLTELQLRVYQLLEQVEDIQKEYNYQRYREEIFRETSSSTIRHIIKYLLIQSGLIFLIGLWRKKALKFRWSHLNFCGFSCRSLIGWVRENINLIWTRFFNIPPCGTTVK